MNEPINERVSLTVRGERRGVSRREAMQWVMGAVAAAAVAESAMALPVGQTVTPQEDAAKMPDPNTNQGYGVDPPLQTIYKPGDAWPLTFNNDQKATARALAAVIIPKDKLGPAAGEVGAVEMIDEWISAPYPEQLHDRPIVLNGLKWIEAEAKKRFGKEFTELSIEQKHAICDDICFIGAAKPEFLDAARFFTTFRNITASAYYATPAGWESIGYVGNVALERFDGPPAEVLARLGVSQTVV